MGWRQLPCVPALYSPKSIINISLSLFYFSFCSFFNSCSLINPFINSFFFFLLVYTLSFITVAMLLYLFFFLLNHVYLL